LVVEGGTIVEQGRHDELVARDEAYAALVRIQERGRDELQDLAPPTLAAN
jgi:hypothetical protein